MPSSRHAMMMRMAISPRLAIRIFLNIARCFYREQTLPVLDGLPVLDVHTHDLSIEFRVDLVHQLHRFDDAENLAFLYDVADLDKRRRARLRRAKEGADDRRLHDRQVDF